MKSLVRRVVVSAAGLLPDALMISGAASVSWGAQLVYEPAGWVVAGAFALVGGVLLARSAK